MDTIRLFRVEKLRRAVRVVLTDGRRLDGDVFLAERTRVRAEPQEPIDMLNEEMRLAGFGFREEHRVDWAATVDGYRSWREWPNLTAALLEHGYSDDEVRGFLGLNFLRLFRESVG